MTGDDDKRIYTLSEETPIKAVIRMGVPLVVGMFVMVLYNLVDTYFIGMLNDDYQLAAVNLGYPVMMVMVALSNMIGTGSSSFIARCLGAGDKNKAEHTLTTGFVLTFINGLIVTVAGLIFLGPIVTGLGAKANTFLFTKQYVRILFIGSIFTMGSFTAGAFLRSEGSVKQSMIGMIAGPVINVVLDPLFIFTLGMKIEGAAIATVLGNAAGLIISLIFYINGTSILRPSSSYLKPTKEIVIEIYRVGLPASLETLLTSAAYVVNNNLAVAYGELTVAAMGVAQKVLSLGTYTYQGFASGVQPIMGYNFGAHNYKRMKKILQAGVTVVTSVELILMAIYALWAPFMIGLFTDSPDVIVTGARVLRAMIFILPFVGSVSMCRMSFQAMGKPGYAFGITVVRQLILYIPLLLILDHFFRFTGLIYAQPVTEAIMMVVSIRLLLIMINRTQAVEAGDADI